MSTSPLPPAILVVDDDRRVVELLSIALTAYGFRVLQASDGEEAVRVALRERPDLVVLDVRLPRKSGFEVCEALRQDPEDPHVPIIMVSAAAETESRLQGLSRGADDYVAKPFSPKELIARIKRLLARSSESREARRRGLAAEQELAHAREDARRSHQELRGEQRLRDLTHLFVRDFHGVLDLQGLAVRLLGSVQFHLGASSSVLLEAADGGAFGVTAARGELVVPGVALRLAPDSELVALLRGLGRPMRRSELERFPEMTADLGPLSSAGLSVLAPIPGPDGLQGILALGERLDGHDYAREDLDVLSVMCETASVALHNARRCRLHAEGLLDVLVSIADRGAPLHEVEARREAARWVLSPASVVVAPHDRALLERAIPLAAWAATPEGQQAMWTTAERDPSGWCTRVLRLLDRRGASAPGCTDGETADEHAAALLEVATDYARFRAAGAASHEAAAAVLEKAPAVLDDSVRRSLARAISELEAADSASV